jgi:hypothetical protein
VLRADVEHTHPGTDKGAGEWMPSFSFSPPPNQYDISTPRQNETIGAIRKVIRTGRERRLTKKLKAVLLVKI